MNDLLMTSSAQFSAETPPVYRYVLSRIWDDRKSPLVFIGMNPSVADETVNDPTIARQMKRAATGGYGALVVLNAFAFRTPKPAVMKKAHRQGVDIVGPQNDHFIRKHLIEAKLLGGLVYAGWGPNGALLNRDQEVLHIAATVGVALHCLEITKGGFPGHPLYTSYETPFQPYVRIVETEPPTPE